MRLRPHVLLCCLLAGPIADRASAQGTSGMLPTPISSRDLDVYGETLDLTREQRDAIDAIHEQYREDFRVLREGDIEAYMGEVSGMWRAGFRSLNRKAIKESIQKLDRVMSKIRLTDDRLFDGIQATLTDEQSMQLARVMQARDRQRYRSGGTRMVGFVNRAARIDVSRLYAGLELTETEAEATDPFVLQYEGRLSAETKALYMAATRMFLDVVKSLEEQGISFDDPAAMMQNPRGFREAMTTAWGEAMKKPRDKASAISALNRRSVRQISELMESGTATTFRDRYLRRAYAEVPRTSASAAHRGYQAVLNRRDLPESVQSDVQAAAAIYRANRVVVVEEMIDAIDAFRSTWTPMGGGRRNDPTREDHETTLEGFKERLKTIDATALDALYAMIDAELAQTIRTAVASGSFDSDEGDGEGLGGAAANAESTGGLAPLGPDPYLPTPITRRDIATYRERLKLGDNDWYILQSLHEEYVGNFNRIRETDFAALRAAEKTLKPAEDDENATGPTPDQIDAVYELRAKALTSIQQIDGLFFDDIETLLATPEQQPDAQRLRLARDRFTYNRGQGQSTFSTIYGGGRQRGRGNRRSRGGWGGLEDTGSMEAAVDLGRLVDALDLAAEDRAETGKLLVEYETAARDGFRRQYATSIKLRREAEKLRARTQQQRSGEGGQDRERRRNRWQAYRDLMEGDGEKADKARRLMVDLNRGALSTLTDALSADSARLLKDAYNRAAFPEIYDNPRAAGRYLVAALELPDVNDQQRTRIESIHAQYEPDFRQVADRMRDVYAEPAEVSGEGRDRWRGYQQRRNKLDVLEFDRREVNARAFRQLRDILTEAQETRLRLPAETPRGDDES